MAAVASSNAVIFIGSHAVRATAPTVHTSAARTESLVRENRIKEALG